MAADLVAILSSIDCFIRPTVGSAGSCLESFASARLSVNPLYSDIPFFGGLPGYPRPPAERRCCVSQWAKRCLNSEMVYWTSSDAHPLLHPSLEMELLEHGGFSAGCLFSLIVSRFGSVMSCACVIGDWRLQSGSSASLRPCSLATSDSV